MRTFFGVVGALVVGLCVGMASMTFCPYLSKFVCQARCQAGLECHVKCDCEKCDCCKACPGKVCPGKGCCGK